MQNVARITAFGEGRYDAAVPAGGTPLGALLEAHGIEPDGRRLAINGHPAGTGSTVLEGDDCVGGIARTVCYRGYRFDIGGHRFFTKVDEVRKIWQEIMGDEFLVRPRLSRIYYVDLDAHFGDGVQDAFAEDDRVLTLSIHETGRWQGEIWNRRKNGEIYAEWLSISRVGPRPGYCKCGYDLEGNVSSRCPECGEPMSAHDSEVRLSLGFSEERQRAGKQT